MLLGTDIQAVLTTLTALDVAGHRAQLLDRPRGHARRDPLPRRELARCRSTASPTPGLPAPGPRRRDDLPRGARAPGRHAAASSSSATASASSAAAAAPRPTTSGRSWTRVGGRKAGPAARAGPADGLEHDDRHPAGPGAAPDAGRRARELAGLAQGQGAAAGRRLRRPGPGRRGPGRGRRPRARPLRRAHRAPGRGRADARGGQARVADPARADPGRLDRARGDRRRRWSRSPAARSSTRSTSRPAATRPTP